MALDLSQGNDVEARHDRGVVVPIKTDESRKVTDTYQDESGNTQESYVLMAGIYSRRYKRKKQQQEDRKFDRGGFTEGKFTNDGKELVIACVIDWKGVTDNGQPLECTPPNVRRFFDQFPWVFEDCDQAMNAPASFLAASSPAQ